MKVAVLGAKWSPCAEPMDQIVVPATGLPSPSVQVKAVPPHSWTSIPRCRLYQACSAGASLALKKMPPMPVTRFMEPPRKGGGEGEYAFCDATLGVSGHCRDRFHAAATLIAAVSSERGSDTYRQPNPGTVAN